MLNNFEAMLNNQMVSKNLDVNKDKDQKKLAKFALKVYNKINGTNFKSKTPKIIIFKVDCRKQSNIA